MHVLSGKSSSSPVGPNIPEFVADGPTYKDAPINLHHDEVAFVTPIKLDFVDICGSLEDDFLIIPPDMMANGSIPYERTLYGYFVGDRLAFPFVKDRTLELWNEHGLCDIFINDDDVFFFKFDNDVGMNYVLQKGIWKIKGIPLFLRKWDADVFIEKPSHDRVPVVVVGSSSSAA